LRCRVSEVLHRANNGSRDGRTKLFFKVDLAVRLQLARERHGVPVDETLAEIRRLFVHRAADGSIISAIGLRTSGRVERCRGGETGQGGEGRCQLHAES
jgi:hypothetical protein